MISQYLLPQENITFEQLGNISSWKPSYVIWAFESWSYLLEKNVSIVNYDSIDYELWVTNGFDAMKNSISAKEFEYIKKNTYDTENLKESIKKDFTYDNFKYVMRKPTWEDVLNEFSKPGICDLTLNSSINKLVL